MIVKPGTEWESVFARCRSVAPEAFESDRLLNFWGGRWRQEGVPTETTSPLDGTVLIGPPRLGLADAKRAVRASLNEHRTWCAASLAERKRRVLAALDELAEHRDLLALLLVWEIGKTWRSAKADVDRCLDGVRWYAEEIDDMLIDRRPLPGPVSNIASWNYPMSVLMHAVLVQALAGNAAIAKAPTDGGVNCLTLATALVARHGLPVTLVSGSGAELSEALVTSPMIGCLSFVGGRSSGGEVAARLVDSGKQHILEQEGLNCWGVWEFSDWPLLARHVRASFEYGKQRCTAYPRYVVQRSLFDDFLAAYLPAVRELTFGHPLAVADPADPLPELDFGPLINDVKVKELRDTVDDAIGRGAVPLFRGSLEESRFLPGQDTAAYLAPVSLLNPPPSSPLHHAEPFGPVDTVVLVDTEAELLAAMNASNGSLVASLACDDETTARRLAAYLQAFKVGVNRPRSRGDRAEYFGGRGASWRGAFVGGELLVHAVTEGEGPVYGHFPTSTRYPPT
ncbi:acyl-CoA reductase-like NAD-dependent aldehyde dehydrogenase [Amycolatopsis bartoniae]|uniref:Aldehyde dehydrogenase n=1 Tax=Amycolatopsis bartoniae TaxID=941986 RepID=A0A8H9J3V9_9PSEU|nr:aldehyde dehydrogenase family protein [Amycolatopsis bartoniae]MBB2937501.1 acyl-CoA reductase-like NAD-dependent aldehyde dehydrogenase [Amycolatopsis bartoniae]TVS99047.1 aldehyde dehydrogenase [Amycolatopsis bartoniae]GHF81796.1 aldehyde dehydrogenase [Amycolatopsis bartoniae]